jgi:N-acetylglucosamine-6-phosphate deacetylase
MRIALTADRLFTPHQTIEGPVVLIEEGRIAAVAPRAAIEIPPGTQTLSYPGHVIAPASFDVHTHGAAGHDSMEGDEVALMAIGLHHASRGVAGYLATTVTAPIDLTLRALEGMADVIESWDAATPAARPLGIHIEGPFISPHKRGVHNPTLIVPPDIKLFDRFWQAARGHIRLMTIAPEMPGAIALIHHARALGVRLSLGHSNAIADETIAGIEAGASSATHTFNAMRALDHREPGILGTVLDRDDLFAELICDGIHVTPPSVRIFARCKPAGRAILVTDSMSATGMPEGNYMLGEIEVQVANGIATTNVGTYRSLAGSVLTLDRAIVNFTAFTRLPLSAAVRMASFNPAQMLGVEDRIGSLAPGREANLNILTAEGELAATMLHGQLLDSD